MSEQKRAALAKGQERRMARYALKSTVTPLSKWGGMAAVASIIADPPEEVASAEVGAVLKWIRRGGPRVIEQWCSKARVWRDVEFVRLDALTDRERNGLVEALDLTTRARQRRDRHEARA